MAFLESENNDKDLQNKILNKMWVYSSQFQ